MDFEKLLEQEARKAARQDYEEVTEKTKDYSYKYSKAFIQKMNAMIHEEKRKAKKKRRWHILLVAAIILILNAGIVLANDDLREKVGSLSFSFSTIISIYAVLKRLQIQKKYFGNCILAMYRKGIIYYMRQRILRLCMMFIMKAQMIIILLLCKVLKKM